MQGCLSATTGTPWLLPGRPTQNTPDVGAQLVQRVTVTDKEDAAEPDPATDHPRSPTLDVNLFLSSFVSLQDSV